ncbi:MAG: hypothetical protein HFH36_11380 [Lachnospiraceae bacterium]|nr:hypothetical protein [Lachnospiraceae bacterium]
MITFHPFLLAASVFFVGSATFLCSSLAIRSTVKLTPVEAANYMETAAGRHMTGRTCEKTRDVGSGCGGWHGGTSCVFGGVFLSAQFA